LRALEGEYVSHAMRVIVEVRDGELVAEISGASAPLTPVDAHTFNSMLGPVAFFDGLARWRMRVMKRVGSPKAQRVGSSSTFNTPSSRESKMR
jgi:hypothetical protein